jgi:hypothetical protein
VWHVVASKHLQGTIARVFPNQKLEQISPHLKFFLELVHLFEGEVHFPNSVTGQHGCSLFHPHLTSKGFGSP